MRIRLYVHATTPAHVTFGVFVEGAHAGTLTLRTTEVAELGRAVADYAPSLAPGVVLELSDEGLRIELGRICPRCGRTSYNPNDVREGYCGACHDWTGTPA
jgi:ribosomal protein S27AE